MDELLAVSDEVAAALADHRPVVALESSLIAHGPAYPRNVEIAVAVEKAVRDSGAVPATIGLADGRFVIGMDEAMVARFAEDRSIPKVSARDIGRVLAGGGLGATTVASTIVAAERSGIQVFSTAGIGGVHRGAQQSFDISADLLQFTRTRIAVVCAGAKSILDLPLTVEYLETAGVPVLGYQCAELPAFYSRSSGLPVPRVDDLPGAARAIDLHWQVHGGGTVLLTVPIDEEHALDRDQIEQAIQQALAEAQRAGVTGNAVSPFMMKAVGTATNGRSGAATRSVLISTAAVAGELAVAMSALTGRG
ncbi:pseudouridine-5'-phosphate glycosidase [Kibdelosporangium aridum]|uniref:Pseudouridine-5'-phosphate glycosidase n=1 Tax=Kibdelosporangium aridum TaxID=2030 RepID=A0A428YCN5_KIBAR|nr:pseudouridine-5'-phosphate glycosidase [Kibdelosporangium aridum]RSM65252.1 pseudouridine-5'-phosphate glycosidase [Kibdelosporangium aridum]